METNNQYQPANTSSMRGNSAGGFNYDIEAEKERIRLGTEEIKKELQERFNKKYANAQIFPATIEAMHPEVRDFLLSFGLVAVYDSIAKQINLDAKGRNILPKIVWQIALSKNWDGLDQVLEQQLYLVHSAHVRVVNLLQQNILNKVRALGEKPISIDRQATFQDASGAAQAKKQNSKLPLSDALSQFPNLGEQNVTSSQLKLRYFPEPVRPSIKNWITDYRDNFGAGKHSPIDRGNFLFHSENGKTLSAFDRQRLGAILKSLDEQTLLVVDGETQKIVFESSVDNEMQGEKRAEMGLKGEVRAGSEMQRGERGLMGETRIGNEMGLRGEVRVGSENFGVDGEKKIDQSRNAAKINFLNTENNIKWSQNQNDSRLEKIEEQQDVDALSDDALFARLQKKNAEKNSAFRAGNVQSDNVSFSSPQTFGAEQRISAPARNPYHISPSSRNETVKQQSNSVPKVNGNVVDLKN